MARLLIRRAAQGIVVIWLVATATFLLLHLAPGDPVAASLDNPLTPVAVRDHWRRVYGLDRPLAEQYWRYLSGVARGDLGFSFPHRESVGTVLAAAIPNTLLLMGVALALAFALGISLGVLQAHRRGSALDRGLGVVTLLLYSVPEFWLALMMALVFAYKMRWFPLTGMVDPVLHPYLGLGGRTWDRVVHLVLPAATLAVLATAVVARFQRAAMLDVAQQDFVRTARAKGLGERAVALRHELRNALLPVITLFGLAFPALLGGSVFVEKIFAWPGMGLLTVDAIGTRDYPLLTGAVIAGSAMVVAGSLLADLLSAAADPRVRST